MSLEKLIDNIIKELTQSSEICATINKLISGKTPFKVNEVITQKEYIERILKNIEDKIYFDLSATE